MRKPAEQHAQAGPQGSRRAVFRTLLVMLALSIQHVRPGVACQSPPRSPEDCGIHVELVALTPSIAPGETIRVEVTVMNADSDDRLAPPVPYQNDRLFHIAVSGCDEDDPTCLWGPPSPCPPGGGAGVGGPATESAGYASDVIDGSRSVLLDDAWAPLSDGATVATEVFNLVPREPWWPIPGPDVTWPYHGYSVEVVVTVTHAAGQIERCRRVICIELEDPAEPVTTPTAEFADPVQSGPAGSDLTYALSVSRNGYPSDVPLTVRVIPYNESDLLDLFPVRPAEVTTTGVELVGDESVVEFECSLHGPCFVGARNDYQVTISDGATVLWDSRVFEQSLGSAHVDDAPLARLELVEILGGAGDDRLASCESGTLHLRATARNAALATPLRDAVLHLPLPAGLAVSDYELHFHDNPLDGVFLTPEQLAAEGTVTRASDSFRVDVESIAARFEGTSRAPERFEDLFEVELYIDLPQEGLGSIGELVFEGFTVEATASGQDLRDVAAPLRIPVEDSVPEEVSSPLSGVPLLVHGDSQAITWDAGALESAGPFSVYRGLVRDLSTSYVGDCIASNLTEARFIASERPAVGSAFFYLVGASNCLGPGPLGGSRQAPEVCP